MRRIPFYLCDSFTETPFQGNPAGVFFEEGAGLSDDEMRLMAGEVHLESAFVLPADDNAPAGADFRLRYFTGVCEVPLCGHATIAAVTVLRKNGRLQAGQPQQAATRAGLLEVGVAASGTAMLRQRSPEFEYSLSAAESREVTNALGFDWDSAHHPTLPIQRVSTGTPWLLVPVRDRAFVDQTPEDFDAITKLSDKHGTFGTYVFVLDRAQTGSGESWHAWSRCYAPKVGLNEDPVTGSASGALGGYLVEHGVLPINPGGDSTFTIQQGFAGGRGGDVTVQVGRSEDGAISPVTIHGKAIILSEGMLTLP